MINDQGTRRYFRDLISNHLVIERKMDVVVEEPHLQNDVAMAPPSGHLSRRRWLVGPIAFMYIASYTMSIFAFSQYVYINLQYKHFGGAVLDNAVSICVLNTTTPFFATLQKVQKEASSWTIYYSLAGGIISIATNLVLGSLTDRYGRKFLFFVACSGTLVRTLISLAGIHYDFKLMYHMVGYVIEGLTGQIYSLLLVSYTYVADITSPGKQRSLGIAMIELAIGLGVSLLSLATGYFIQNTKPAFIYPMLTAAIILVATMVMACFLPEPYTRDRRVQTTSRFANLKDAVNLYFGSSNYGNRWRFNLLAIVFMCAATPVIGRTSVEGLYQLNAPFCFTPEKLGWFAALRSGIQQVLSMALVAVLQICLKDEHTAMVGCISLTASFVLEALAKTELVLYLVTAVGAAGLLTLPMVRAILSRLTPAHQQGAVFASIAMVETTVGITSVVASSGIYSATVDVFSGSVFLFYAILGIIGLLLMIVIALGSRSSGRYTNLKETAG